VQLTGTLAMSTVQSLFIRTAVFAYDVQMEASPG
jgi:hypothetical protein